MGWARRRAREEATRQARRDAALRGADTKRAKAEKKAAEFKRRSEAATKGWETVRAREREEWPIPETGEWIVEEPIDTVGGKVYKKKGK